MSYARQCGYLLCMYECVHVIPVLLNLQQSQCMYGLLVSSQNEHIWIVSACHTTDLKASFQGHSHFLFEITCSVLEMKGEDPVHCCHLHDVW